MKVVPTWKKFEKRWYIVINAIVKRCILLVILEYINDARSHERRTSSGFTRFRECNQWRSGGNRITGVLGLAHIETQANAAQGSVGQGDATQETLRDTVLAHIETQADAGQGRARQGAAARETLRDTVLAHIETQGRAEHGREPQHGKQCVTQCECILRSSFL